MERLNPKILDEVEGKERYRVGISNRFAALDNLDNDGKLIELGKLLERMKQFQPK
jgi:hypothetical protein